MTTPVIPATSGATAVSLLEDPERHEVRPPEWAASLGRTLVAAPHPDDESLGCGGLLSLLADAGQHPHVLVLTDGSRSHTQSPSYPAARLAALREGETLRALTELGLPACAAQFLRFGDCALPAEHTAAFADAVSLLRDRLTAIRPDTLLVPWRRDPHCDHQATWRLMRTAWRDAAPFSRWLEYPVWAWTQASGDAAPRADEASAWRLDISPVLARKARAIAQHRSQLGEIIDDDPTGFALQHEVLTYFLQPWELYLEPGDV